MTDSGTGSTREGKPCKHKSTTEGLTVSGTGSRRHRVETGAGAPIRLRYWGNDLCEVTTNREFDLSTIILELPLSELARLLPQRIAVELYQIVRKFFKIPESHCFPRPLAELVRNGGLLSAVRARLPKIENLIELITDPLAILMDERQQLCFFKGFSINLRPISFSYLFLLAQSPGKFVMRSAIYKQLWPGELTTRGPTSLMKGR